MTKVIRVYDDGDYGAMTFDQSGISVEDAYKAAKNNAGEWQYNIDGDEVYVNSYEFGEVDQKFIDFIRNNFIDYDQSKACDFYIVKGDE